jgi:hypothetical protein
MSRHRVYVDGLACWSPRTPDWPSARAAFRGEAALLDPPVRRPAPELLAPTERRRAPDTVAIALEVASRAVAQSGRLATELPSVFSSAHGDLAINDYMCATLVAEPGAISPTRFHNSVHNAAAGYWTIGTGCMQASTALTAYLNSFAQGLLEAASQCSADHHSVLMVAYDIAALGPLASVTTSREMLAVAFVLAPERGPRSIGQLDWQLVTAAVSAPRARSPAAQALAVNAIADCLPLLEGIADGSSFELELPLDAALALQLAWKPCNEPE